MLENKKPVSSIKHFEGLTKQFHKIAIRVIRDYEFHTYYGVFNEYIETKLDEQVNLLLKTYKSNMHKTKSCYQTQVQSKFRNSFWISYGFEDENYKRTGKPTRIVFRLYTKISFYKKKLLVRWVVPINWE